MLLEGANFKYFSLKRYSAAGMGLIVDVLARGGEKEGAGT